jgi:hypothetical protein
MRTATTRGRRASAAGFQRLRHLVVNAAIGASLLVAACAGPTVRQQDLDAWVGMPVEALDTQALFVTIPMIRTEAEGGVEIRNYASGRGFPSCAGSAGTAARGSYVSAEAFANCTGGWDGCSNLFYLSDGKVREYAPTGRCATNESVLPKARYLHPKAASGVE